MIRGALQDLRIQLSVQRHKYSFDDTLAPQVERRLFGSAIDCHNPTRLLVMQAREGTATDTAVA
jgi:hypothetical protein